MLCHICQSIDFDKLIPNSADPVSNVDHHETFANLVAAADLCCELCALIQDGATQLVKQSELREQMLSRPITLRMRFKGRAHADYQGSSELWVLCLGRIISQLEVFIPESSSILARPDLKLISGRPISSTPASEESFTLAKSWIHNCLNSAQHSYCPKEDQLNAPTSEASLPTRLIDVGPSDGSREPRLILSSALNTSGARYLALSHCWGQAQLLRISNNITRIDFEAWVEDQRTLAKLPPGGRPLTTTIKSLNSHLQQIPLAVLPKTFQDAVVFTRGLGLRYIWIDSLCIIQDSASDWQKEAARMADVYRNAYLTLAAEASKDSHAGMFKDRSSESRKIRLLFNSTARKFRSEVYVRRALESWDTCINGLGSSLRTRAWVLQESLLAPRTIHMGSQQMFWECRSRSLAEGNITPIPPNKQNEKPWDWSHNKRFVTDPLIVKSLYPEAKDILYLQWATIIRDYSYRKLSFPSDIFPALEGLAREFNRRLQDNYVGGLWKRDFLRGLLWRVTGSKSGEIAREASPYRAPSWSWASIEGAEFDDAGNRIYRMGSYHAELLDVQIYAENGNIDNNTPFYGQIKNAVLTLKGRWTPCSRWPRFEEKLPIPEYIVPDTEDDFGNMFCYFDSALEESHEARHERGRALGLLEIAAWGQNPSDFPIVHYLILESGDSANEDRFKRVGIASLLVESATLEQYEKWVQDWEMKEVRIV